jgi:hypothetical protein
MPGVIVSQECPDGSCANFGGNLARLCYPRPMNERMWLGSIVAS